MPADPTSPRFLCEQARHLALREPHLPAVLGFDPGAQEDDAALIREVLLCGIPEGDARDAVRALAKMRVAPGSTLFEVFREDVAITALRDQDPGGEIATLLFGNGLHALLAYRLAHALHLEGQSATALGLKAHFLRSFGADIMPQARIGRRVWLDHGLAIVIGQTAVIEEDVSIWHGVTLGTNLTTRGEGRHPTLRRGCVIGAGAHVIGPVEIGAGAVVAAGATVVGDVPARALAVGASARILEGRAKSPRELGIRLGALGD